MKKDKKCYVCEGNTPTWIDHDRCEKHDVCLTCGINRKDLKEPPWGDEKGFVCKSCEEQTVKDKVDSFQATEPEEMDLYSNDKIICPNCGEEHESDGESTAFYSEDSHDFDCGECNTTFVVETRMSFSYQTSIKQ
ncbi:MAG: hypothetical protein DRH97_00045 [Chloroflexi bacterium]|nr:MAG: hypothetical protein DRH97_00045 [Chloroflexota bacterium]